jgi:hypothetical protein
MKITQEFGRMMRQEFPATVANLIYCNDDGSYQVFDHYRIANEKSGYRVYCSATDVGIFGTTRSAMSWCIADKHKLYTLSRNILELDTKLRSLTSDIGTRAGIADASREPQFRETISTKLETKIIRKKQVEAELTKCVNWAKYIQHRGFNNETIRTSRPAIKERR